LGELVSVFTEANERVIIEGLNDVRDAAKRREEVRRAAIVWVGVEKRLWKLWRFSNELNYSIETWPDVTGRRRDGSQSRE
jgi:hypothetical protein